MTALTISTDIPTNINTLEKLAAWVGLALERCNPSTKILESPNSEPQRVAEAVLIRADDATHRMIIRVSIPINDGYAENSLVKFWQNALEINSTALPTAYKAN
ncbi:glucose-6-phosphate dehydrogenase [Chlorogloea sp. CCALA 695]|uniref:glucose-6-phosphate dehydrogenase n=1 Tax=Chlorogloea sp. CCALA 695 TaxID=2107693 RepID=UPI000D04FDA2|nr:glucose-6-phosphate dehydrogenase [Chlorogloea sp. CCALA 695]PSB27466.1 glucose-6-phosphate dehydrogenase [Chlorogloea sp. CCALA 695]